jgi:hypothetical protein
MLITNILKLFAFVTLSFFFIKSYAQPNIAITEMAYLLADQPTTQNYTPDLNAQYNSTGVPNTITREGTGKYKIIIPNLMGGHGNAQVSAMGNIVICRINQLSVSDNNLIVKIYCSRDVEVGQEGKYTDSKFYFIYLSAR